MHLPTKRIFIEDVVRFLIREFEVDPIEHNWEAIIDENLAAVQRGRTW